MSMRLNEEPQKLLNILENIETMVSPTDKNRLLTDVEKEVLKMEIVHQLGMEEKDYTEMIKKYIVNNPSSVDEIIKYQKEMN